MNYKREKGEAGRGIFFVRIIYIYDCYSRTAKFYYVLLSVKCYTIDVYVRILLRNAAERVFILIIMIMIIHVRWIGRC